MTTGSYGAHRWAALLALVLAACGSRPSAVAQVHRSTPARADTPVVVIVDTDETIWPDPGERTWVRLGSLQHLIARFEEENGRVPARLEEVLPRGEAPSYMYLDAWGSPIRYTATGTEYELHAAGPDGSYGTADDLRAGRDTPPPSRRVEPEALTRGVLTSIELSARTFRSRFGAFPDSLAALHAAGLQPLLGEKDGWGNPVVYTRLRGGIELRSSGPDAVQGNTDDIVLDTRTQ
jgi:hypothetical protein